MSTWTNKHCTPPDPGCCPTCWRYGQAVPLQAPCPVCAARKKTP